MSMLAKPTFDDSKNRQRNYNDPLAHNFPSTTEGYDTGIDQFINEEAGIRLWMVTAMVLACMLLFMIIVCCVIKIRIPRTKREIEIMAAKRKKRQRKIWRSLVRKSKSNDDSSSTIDPQQQPLNIIIDGVGGASSNADSTGGGGGGGRHRNRNIIMLNSMTSTGTMSGSGDSSSNSQGNRKISEQPDISDISEHQSVEDVSDSKMVKEATV